MGVHIHTPSFGCMCACQPTAAGGWLAWCRQEGVWDLIRARWGWLLVFFAGLMVAAVVVEAFESVLEQHVELSYFVPLLIGDTPIVGVVCDFLHSTCQVADAGASR